MITNIVMHLRRENIDDLANIARSLDASRKKIEHTLRNNPDIFKGERVIGSRGWLTLWRLQ